MLKNKLSNKVKLNCKNCGKEFFVFPSALKYANKQFCRKQCHNEDMHKQGTTTKICPTCGKEFEVLKNQAKRRVHCSYICMGLLPDSYDLDFLDEDTPFRSWFLGWIMSDGDLAKDRELKNGELRGKLGLKGIIDREIIDIIAEKVHYKNKIDITESYKKKAFGKEFMTKESYGIQFKREEIVSKMLEFGFFIGGKTGKEFIPDCISDETFFHFLRGMFEGDGNFHVGKKTGLLKWRLFCTNKKFLEEICERLRKLELVRGGSLYKREYNEEGMIWILCFGHYDSVNISKFMYKNSEGMRLTRKYEMFLKAKDRELKSVIQDKECSVEDCFEKPLAKGMCGVHYRREKAINKKNTEKRLAA